MRRRHSEVIFHAEAHWLSREKVLERVFQPWQELRVYLAQQGYPIPINFQILALFESQFSVMNHTVIYIWGNWLWSFSHVAATTQKTAGHGTRNTKINESKSIFLLSWSLYNTQCEPKKKSPLNCDCSRWISSASFEKCGLNPVSKAFFIRGSKSLTEFAFSFYFDKIRKSLLAKVDCWHRITNVNRILGEISVFRNAEWRRSKMD